MDENSHRAKYETKEGVEHYFRHQISNKDLLTHLYFTTHSDALAYLESNHEQVKLYIVYISQATEIEYLKKLWQLEVNEMLYAKKDGPSLVTMS